MKPEVKEAKPQIKKPGCGVIMPISDIENYPLGHWLSVQKIIYESIETAGFECNFVSKSGPVNVIPKTIVQNIYDNEIIICDVSGRAPNVMFELSVLPKVILEKLLAKSFLTRYLPWFGLLC